MTKKQPIVLTPATITRRLFNNHVFEYTYKNPFLLAYMYYTEGLSTVDIANFLGCEQRTVRRYMNYYGFRRFTKSYAQLVNIHGIEDAQKIKAPEFYPLGKYND